MNPPDLRAFVQHWAQVAAEAMAAVVAAAPADRPASPRFRETAMLFTAAQLRDGPKVTATMRAMVAANADDLRFGVPREFHALPTTPEMGEIIGAGEHNGVRCNCAMGWQKRPPMFDGEGREMAPAFEGYHARIVWAGDRPHSAPAAVEAAP